MDSRALVAECLDRNRLFEAEEFLQAARLSAEVMERLLEEGILQPDEGGFHGEALCRARKAIRLHDQLGINWPGVALALDLLDRIATLEAELQRLEAFPRW